MTVLEQSPRWGGKLDTTLVEEVGLDSGAESVLARRPEAVGLITALGLEAQRVHPTSAKPQLLVGGRVHAMPPSLQGVPVDVPALAGLLSADGLARALGEPERPAPPLTGGRGDRRVRRCALRTGGDRPAAGAAAGAGSTPGTRGTCPSRPWRPPFRPGPDGRLAAGARAGQPAAQHRHPGLRRSGRRRRGPGAGAAARPPRPGRVLRTGTAVRALDRGTGGRGDWARVGPAPEQLAADAVVLAAPAGPAGRLAAALLPAPRPTRPSRTPRRRGDSGRPGVGDRPVGAADPARGDADGQSADLLLGEVGLGAGRAEAAWGPGSTSSGPASAGSARTRCSSSTTRPSWPGRSRRR